jgi:hypothetical protein
VDDGTCGIICATTREGDSALQVHAVYGAVETSVEPLVERV